MNNELERDVRIIQRKLAKGFTSSATIDSLLADLPDVSEQGEWFDPEDEDEVTEGEEAAEAEDAVEEAPSEG
jgi:hypothetical protein